jgi:hypothetical protein
MKKTLFVLSLIAASQVNLHAQGLKGFMKKVTNDSATSASINKNLEALKGGNSSSSLSSTDIAAGLKQALEVGAQNSGNKLSSVDGFFANAALKILMPEEAKNAEQKLRSLGFGKQVDNAILSMNRAAEDASKSAADIFIKSIKQMSFSDAVGILKGNDHAATDYLKGKTTTELTNAFRPVIEQSLAKVDATKYWNTVFSNYNRFSADKVNPDLSAYVTEKALAGIFFQVAQEEQSIRKDPAARTTDLLKKVFAK